MSAADQNATVYAGDDAVFNYTLTNQSGAPLDLTGATFAYTISAYDGSVAVVTKTTASGGINVTNATGGLLSVSLSHTDTTNLSGSMWQQLVMTDASGNVSTLSTGYITFLLRTGSGTVAANLTVDLTSLSDAQAWMAALSVSAVPTDQLQQMVTAMSDAIQAWLGYNLIQQTYTATFDGRGTSKVAFPNSPVTAVSSLYINGQAITPSVGPGDWGYAYATNQRQSWLVLRGGRFTPGFQNCTITYTAGFASNAIPPALVQACREAITAYSQVTAREPGLTKEKVGGLEEDYAAPASSPSAINNFVLTPGITLALMPLRRVAPAW